MRISHLSYQKYIDSIKNQLIGEKLYSPILLNNRTLVFPFMEKRRKIAVISLDNKNPILFLSENDCFFSTFENTFLNQFRKHVGKSEIRNIKLRDDDLVIDLDLYSIDELEDYKLIIELIPSKPNIYVLNKGNIIKEKYFNSKNNINLVGQKYSPTINDDFSNEGIEINEQFLKKVLDKEFEIRNKEKYGDFSKFIDSKIKNASKKIKNIENDVEIASKTLIFKDVADNILSSGTNLKTHQNSYIFNDEEIKLDEAKTLLENAQHFYKKAKKAKETINRSLINIENAKKEIEEFNKIKVDFALASENKKDELVMLFLPSKKKKETKPTILNRPWKVNYNGTIIYFGRNASQNDYLSFTQKLDREFTWLHIKDKSGAHLIIANKKPTEKELLLACEISLLCSHCSSGEIVYTKKKNVRRGHTLGEALLKTYSTIKLNSVSKEGTEIFKQAVRCD